LVVVAVMATAIAASAQVPYFAVYFDQYHGVMAKDCPGPVADVWYVAAVNLNMLIVGAEFQIEYPAAVWYVGDINTPPVTVGNTRDGISMGWGLPENGWGSSICVRSAFCGNVARASRRTWTTRSKWLPTLRRGSSV